MGDTAGNLVGQRFGRYVVIEKSPSAVRPDGRKMAMWLCLCDCGKQKAVRGSHLRAGVIVSCGCLGAEKGGENRTHGQSRPQTTEYRIWAAMKRRCLNPNVRAFSRYGGRGIKVCERWSASFEAFYADMGPRPDGYTLDRIDNDGDYTPNNCRWATTAQQRYNSSAKMTPLAGFRSLSEAAQARGLNPETVRSRIKRGWAVERALR